MRVCRIKPLLVGAILTLLLAALLPDQSSDATRRSNSARTAFKRLSLCPSTGRPTGPCPGWVIDHVTPLACGGPDAPSNMQWQTTADARAKDRWERKGCATSARR